MGVKGLAEFRDEAPVGGGLEEEYEVGFREIPRSGFLHRVILGYHKAIITTGCPFESV